MIALWIALGGAALLIGLGHWRLVDRQADVAAAHRQLEALWQQRARATGARVAVLDARMAATRRIYDAELARYRRTSGARLNRWQPKALPTGMSGEALAGETLADEAPKAPPEGPASEAGG